MKNKKKDLEKWKPNLFVSGFPRSGSTALCDYLDQHHEIFVSKPKEPETLEEYFGFKSKGARLGFEEYKKMFSDYSDLNYRLDGSQTYSRSLSFPKKIKEFNPEAKTILVIREQLKRIISWYWFTYPGHQIDNFEEWVEKKVRKNINEYLLYNRIKEFHKAFGRDLLVLDNSSLKSKQEKVFEKIFMFLKIKQINLKPLKSNPTIFSADDSFLYKKTMSFLFTISDKIKKPFYKIIKKTNFYYRDNTPAKLIRGLRPNIVLKSIGKKISKSSKSLASNDKLIEKIPSDIKEKLVKDYEKTLDYTKNNKILVEVKK